MYALIQRSLARTQRRACATPMQRLALWLLPLLPLSLTACGFHLQGRTPLPHSLAVVRIEAVDMQSEFYYGLRAALKGAGTRIDEEGLASSAAVIHILEDATAERVLTVSALNAPTEYELSYKITVSVSVDGRELLAPEEHLLLRDYSFDEAALLAKERERGILSDALARDLVTILMRRLASL